MEEDFEYDALTLQAPRRVRWYNRLWPACLRCGCLSCKRQEFPLYFVGYDPMGQFQRAASVGDVASVERFINFHGCHVNEVDRRGRTPLHYACAHNHPDVVRLLLSHRANIDILDDEGCTPLIKATQWDNVECVSVLLTQAADPHLMDFSGNTALHHAVSRGNIAIASKLLEYNVDIEGKTEYGLTPYKLALFENQHQMALFLIQNGANVHSEVQSKSVGKSTKRLEQRKKEHGRVNNEVHCSMDHIPFCRLSKEPNTPGSIRVDKDSPSIIKDYIENPSSTKTQETKKQIPHTDKRDRRKKTNLTSWKSEMNLSAHGKTILDTPVKKTFLMTSPACQFDTLKSGEHEGRKNSNKRLGTLVHTLNPCIPEAEVEEKKPEPFPTIPADPGIAVPQPTAHIGSSLGTGDRGEIVEAPKKKDFRAVRNTALDLKLPLGMPLLLLTSLMWFLKIIFLMLAWILQKIQKVLDKKDFPGYSSNKKDEPVAAEDD